MLWWEVILGRGEKALSEFFLGTTFWRCVEDSHLVISWRLGLRVTQVCDAEVRNFQLTSHAGGGQDVEESDRR